MATRFDQITHRQQTYEVRLTDTISNIAAFWFLVDGTARDLRGDQVDIFFEDIGGGLTLVSGFVVGTYRLFEVTGHVIDGEIGEGNIEVRVDGQVVNGTAGLISATGGDGVESPISALESQLSTCQDNLSSCESGLSTCQSDLNACRASDGNGGDGTTQQGLSPLVILGIAAVVGAYFFTGD